MLTISRTIVAHQTNSFSIGKTERERNWDIVSSNEEDGGEVEVATSRRVTIPALIIGHTQLN